MLYLLREVNLKSRPKLLRDLELGTRIISHNYDMGDWKPEKTVRVGDHTLYNDPRNRKEPEGRLA
jgi:hypothetical protein